METNEMRIDAEAVFTGYAAFVKKEDLLVYERLTFTVKEEGDAAILRKIDATLAANDAWTSTKIPREHTCHIDFGSVALNGVLAEISVKRHITEEGVTTTYKFIMERAMDQDTLRSIVIPYFKLRMQNTTEGPNGNVKTVVEALTTPFSLIV